MLVLVFMCLCFVVFGLFVVLVLMLVFVKSVKLVLYSGVSVCL